MIDQSAIIHPTARIGKNVVIGPWTVIGPEVEIGEGSWIGPHVVIGALTTIGRDNKIFQFASVGEIPQDKKFQGERTLLEIGDRNVIREFCTLNRGTAQDKGTTRIGNDNLFMAYVHIAHDCIVGSHTIFANNAGLAGHVIVDDYASLGAFSGVSQFCRVGTHSFVSTNSVVIKDVPPYVKVSGYYAKPFGLNTIGLERRGFTADIILNLKRAYKILYRKGLTTKNAFEELRLMLDECPPIQSLLEFLQVSERGIVR